MVYLNTGNGGTLIVHSVDDLTPEAIAKFRAEANNAALIAYMILRIRHKVSVRVENAIRRAYRQGHLTKPIQELTDDELLSVWMIGVKSLAQIRKAIQDN